MTDNSEIVLEWEIDNATAKLAAGRMESEVFEKGGFKWSVSAIRIPDPCGRSSGDDKAWVTVRCDVDDNRSWKCEAGVEVVLFSGDGEHYYIMDQEHVCFNEKNRSVSGRSTMCWVGNPRYCGFDECELDDSISVEVYINFLNSERDDRSELIMFDAPNNRSDVILLVGDKRIHVSKEMLSIHSPVFEAMFFGNFNEKGKEEVEIKDVVYEEFIDLLHVIYLEAGDITDRSVLYILELADRYQMKGVMNLSMKYLKASNGINVAKKLLLADQYQLTSLKDHCLQSFTSVVDLTGKLQLSPEFADYSEGMKSAICVRIMQLSLL